MKKILVLCTGNSCRSQMAEGFLRKFTGDDYTVFSAGIESHGLNPGAVKVMAEVDVDISHQYSKTIEELPYGTFDFVITVCDSARENCPYFPSVQANIHQDFPDPAQARGSEEEILNAFRKTRDLVGNFCEELSSKLKSGEFH